MHGLQLGVEDMAHCVAAYHFSCLLDEIIALRCASVPGRVVLAGRVQMVVLGRPVRPGHTLQEFVSNDNALTIIVCSTPFGSVAPRSYALPGLPPNPTYPECTCCALRGTSSRAGASMCIGHCPISWFSLPSFVPVALLLALFMAHCSVLSCLARPVATIR